MAEKGKLIEVSDSNFNQEVIEEALPTLVDFWATWCAPCHAISPILEELSNQYNAKIKIAKVNVEESPKTCARYQVRSIPTLILFKDGKIVGQEIGAVPKGRLEGLIKKALDDASLGTKRVHPESRQGRD